MRDITSDHIRCAAKRGADSAARRPYLVSSFTKIGEICEKDHMNEPPSMPQFLQQGAIVTWQGSIVSVRGRWVPKYLWTTMSIDVYLDDQCVLKTGGKLDPGGAVSATFDRGGVNHTAKVSWGGTLGFSFPYLLYIDGALVKSSRVRADNWYMCLFVRLVLWAVVALMVFRFYHRFFQGNLQ